MPDALTVGSLFSGIGGFDLGLERAGMRVIWQSEIDPYASAVLRKHWPEVPNLGDIRTIRNAERPDVICGGFPCQDVSLAGSRLGLDGTMSGLWSEFARVIGDLRPQHVVVENTPGLLSLGMGVVLGDLAALGYDAEWHCIPAAAADADHIRDRVWIIAYPNGAGSKQIDKCGRESCSGEMGKNVADNNCARSPWGMQAGTNCADAPRFGARIRFAIDTAPSFPGLDGAGAPVLGRGEDGIPNRVDRMHAIGNAVVPQIAEIIGRAIVSAQDERVRQRA